MSTVWKKRFRGKKDFIEPARRATHFHFFLRDVADLNDPPGQDGDGLHRLGGEQVLAALAEESELLGGPRLVHEVDVLVPADAEQAET